MKGEGRLFIVDVESRSLRWIPVDGSAGQPQFSLDGRSLTLGIYRKFDDALWRLNPATGELRRLTNSGAAVHRESADGKWVYFVRQREPGLFRIPYAGGAEEVVLDRVVPELYRGWALGRHGIYYTISDGPNGPWLVQYYDPAARSHTPICRLEMPLPRWTGTLSVSRDERWMVFPLHEPEGSSLTLLHDVRV